MTDNINPSHYKTGPFECIELTRLLSFDWGNVVKYAYRWQHKNGLEDLKKALWYAEDACENHVPLVIGTVWSDDTSMSYIEALRLFGILEADDWAGLEKLWNGIKLFDYHSVVDVLKNKIAQVEKEGK